MVTRAQVCTIAMVVASIKASPTKPATGKRRSKFQVGTGTNDTRWLRGWRRWPESAESAHDKPKGLKVHGFHKISSLLSETEASSLRALLFSERPKLPWLKRKALPDVLTRGEYRSVRQVCELPMKKVALHAVLRNAFEGRGYAELGFCDIQVNHSVAWHRDVLQGPLSRFQTHDLWTRYNQDSYGMFRLILYLQDHTKDIGALAVSPGTHLSRGKHKKPAFESGLPFRGVRHLRPALGDAVLIDMRLVHSGQLVPAPWGTRVAVQLTFGAENSSFTTNWARGDTIRRRDQMRRVQFL